MKNLKDRYEEYVEETLEALAQDDDVGPDYEDPREYRREMKKLSRRLGTKGARQREK